MSAIAGIFNFDHAEISKEEISTIETVSSLFVTDRTDTYTEPGLFFSCSHQYFTNEAIHDISPISDREHNIIFNADIFLYNRNELIKKLKEKSDLSEAVLSQKGDAELSYLVYLHFGIQFVNMLYGAYSIVIYDKREHIVYLITDHISNRHLAYSVTDRKLYYSTTLHVISSLLKDPELDEEWIGAAYMDTAPDSERILGRCVYKNVFRIEPGHYIKIVFSEHNNNCYTPIPENIEYWNPLKSVKPLKLSSDEEYGNLFRETFIKTINNMLRGRSGHGIYLSGGLDSSAVASVAAKILSGSSSTLYGFTQVPCEEYKSNSSFFEIEDETVYVLKNKEKYPNIECCFLSSQDPTVFSDPDKYIRRFAQPVKPIINSNYILSLDEAVKQHHLSVVFTGAAGNFTISYGNICSYIYQKNHRFHFISSIREANAYCKLYHANRPKFLKYYFSLKKSVRKELNPDYYTNEYLIKKYQLKKILKKYRNSFSNNKIDSVKLWKCSIFQPLLTQHTFYHHTCASLFTGALYLDPTMSKDIIELCMAMPIDCFVRNGKERRAVRDYLKGIISDDILNNLHQRGVQASDFFFKAVKNWEQSKNILFNNLQISDLDKYLDRKKIDFLVEELKEKEYNLDIVNIVDASVISVLGCFLKNIKKYIEVDKWKKTEN